MYHHPSHARIHEIVKSLREKPEHVRERLAVGVAGGITLLVAVGWFGALSSSKVFTLVPSTHEAVAPKFAETRDNFTQLLGAAGAAIGATSTPSTITVVDTKVHSTLDETGPAPDATTIHF